MGYGRALLQKDVRSEEASLQKKAKKKGLWGSIGRTVGSLGVMAISGGTLNPVTLGLLSGGASFLGGAIGSKAAGGKLTGGKFFKEERADLQRELGGFGSKNIVEALKGGVTAGIGQAAKLYGAGTKAAEAGATAEEVSAIRRGVSFGESFGESMVGRAWEKGAPTRQLAKVRSLQVGEGLVPSLGDTTGVGTGKLPTGKSDIPSLFDMYENELNIEQARSSVSPAIEDTFSTSNNYPLVDKDFGFTEFDEPSWAEGKRKLSNIDYDILNKQINWQDSVFSPSESSSSLLRRPGGLNPRY